MIRRARLEDFPALYAAGEALRARSSYAAVPIDRGRALQGFARCCNHAAMFAQVAVDPETGEADGVLLGMAEPLWWSSSRYATDLMYFASRPWDYVALLRAFVAWAEGIPRVVDITMGASAAIDPERLAVVYHRCGLEPLGGLYSRTVVRLRLAVSA